MVEELGAPGVEGLAERSITLYDSDAITRTGVRSVGDKPGMNARVRALGSVLVIEAWGKGSEIERRPLRPGLPTIDIIFVEEGEFEYLDASQWHVSRGPLMIAPSGLPVRVRFTGEWKFIVARVPRVALLPFVPILTDTVGIFPELTMPEHALHAFLAQVVRSTQDMSEAESQTFDRQVLSMAGALVLGRSGKAISHDTPRGSLRRRALSVIGERSSDINFTPQVLANEVNSSLRRLQEVFSEADTSVAAEIRRERARVARSLLQDPSCDQLDTSEVASRAGFGSNASMRRALEDLYGLAPRELRTLRAPAA